VWVRAVSSECSTVEVDDKWRRGRRRKRRRRGGGVRTREGECEEQENEKAKTKFAMCQKNGMQSE